MAEHERFPHLLRFARQHYDWVVVDLGRGVGVSTLSALEEVESSYLVTTLDVPALHQAKQFARALRDSGYKSERLQVVLNRVSRRAELTAEEIEKMLGTGVAGVLPDDHETLYDAYADGKLAAPDTAFGRRLGQLVTAMAGTAAVKQEKKKKAFSIFG
jgi:pilus assembly protein CpaE